MNLTRMIFMNCTINSESVIFRRISSDRHCSFVIITVRPPAAGPGLGRQRSRSSPSHLKRP